MDDNFDAISYCYSLNIKSLPEHINATDEVYEFCVDIVKKLNKLISKINTDKLPDVEFLIDDLENIIEEFGDCSDNENYIDYFNTILNELYEIADTDITLSPTEQKKFIQIIIN